MNFVSLRAWVHRYEGPAALLTALREVRANFRRCAWVYTLWTLMNLGWLSASLILVVGLVSLLALLLLQPKTLFGILAMFAIVPVILAIIAAMVYVGWRSLRLSVSGVYLDIVLATTKLSGRDALRAIAAATRQRFFLTAGVLLFSHVPEWFLSVNTVADARLSIFITVAVLGFIGTWATLVALAVYHLQPFTATQVHDGVTGAAALPSAGAT
jgi:hypothetical protein